jgi:hypothetical protein
VRSYVVTPRPRGNCPEGNPDELLGLTKQSCFKQLWCNLGFLGLNQGKVVYHKEGVGHSMGLKALTRGIAGRHSSTACFTEA